MVEVESGKRNNLPKLAEALRLCRIHKATLIIAKLDRLARNVAVVSNLMESGVEFTTVDFPQGNRLTVHILAAVAEHEAAMVSQRTRDALASKRAFYARLRDEEKVALAAAGKATQLGGNRGNLSAVRAKAIVNSATAREEATRRRAADLSSVMAEIRASTGAASLRQITADVNGRGIKTARRGEWSAVQVKRVLERGL